MKKFNIYLAIVFGMLTFTNAQGITNTLGGNTSADKFIVENSDSEASLIVTGEGNVGIGTTSPDDIFTISKTLQGAYGPETETLTLIPGSTERGNPASFVTSFPSVRFITPSNIPINGSGVSDVSFTAKNANLMGKLVVGTSGSLTGTDGSALFTGNVIIQGGVNMATTSGNVGIGTTNPLSKLSVGGNGDGVSVIYGETSENPGYGVRGVALGNSGRGVYGYSVGSGGVGVQGYGATFDFYATGPGENYGSSSSIRWKKNIVEIDNPLEKLAELRGVYFDWDEEHGGQHDIGCIAEEVGKVLPEIVVYEENGIDANGMDYSKLTPLLIEAIKALQKRVEELENR